MKTAAIKSLSEQFREWMNLNYNDYKNYNNEVDMTALGEACAEHFNFMSEDGDTFIEETIFEIASEYFNK